MKIKGLVVEDFIQYRQPSMFIIFPYCDFKCGEFCQNKALINEPNIEVSYQTLVNMYLNNKITKAIVFGGLEPLNTWEDTIELIKLFRIHTGDDIVIYTGYTEEEVGDKIKVLSQFKNIIIKFGRFIPNSQEHYDEVLGVELYGKNQYAKRIC